MKHSSLEDLQDEMLEHPDQLFVTANSKHAALLSTNDGNMVLLRGDFSGSPQEREREARRILNETPPRKRRRRHPQTSV